MRGRFILFLVAFAFLTGRAYADETAVTAGAESVATVAAPPGKGAASAVSNAAPDPILLSIPEAGGLRITVRIDSSGKITLHVFCAGHDAPEDIPTTTNTKTLKITTAGGYVTDGLFTTSKEHVLSNLFGTGLDFKIKSGTVLTAGLTSISFAASSPTSGGMSILLPLPTVSASSAAAGAAGAGAGAGAAGSAGGSGVPAPADLRTEFDLGNLAIGHDGKIAFDVTAHKHFNFKIPGGFTLDAQSLEVKYAHNPGGSDDDATITLGPTNITAPVPGILTQNPAPLILKVASATVNTDGQVSFKGATLNGQALSAAARRAGGGSVQVASAAFGNGHSAHGHRGVVGHAKRLKLDSSKPLLTIPLMKPADFVLVVNHESDISLDMNNNVPSGVKVTCDIKLPSAFTPTADAPPDGDDKDRVTIPGVSLDAKTSGFIAQWPAPNTPPPPVTAYFQGFGITLSGLAIDLSDTDSIAYPTGAPKPGGEGSWEGIYITAATLNLPSSLQLQSDPKPDQDDTVKQTMGSAGGNPSGTTPPTTPATSNLTLSLKNCWIDNNGFSGTVALSDAVQKSASTTSTGTGTGAGTAASSSGSDKGKFLLVVDDNWKVHLDQLSVDIERNSIKNCDISGYLLMGSLGDSKISVIASVSTSGMASLQVKTGAIPLDDFNAIMTIENGTFTRDPAKGSQLSLSGTWEFTDKADESIAGLKVSVKDLQFGSNGKFALDSVWIDLPESASRDFGIVSLEARRIGFGGIGDDRTPWVGFNGSVGIGGDLPVQAEADFDGLFIYAGNSKTGVGPSIHVGRIGIDCDVDKVLHVSGFIEDGDGKMTRSVNPFDPAHPELDRSNIKKDGTGFISEDDAHQVPAQFLTENGKPDGKKMHILTGAVIAELPILGGDPDSDSGPGASLEFMIARHCWYVMGSVSAGGNPLIVLGQSGAAIYGFGGGVGYNVKPEVPGESGIPNMTYQIVPDIDAINGTTASGLPDIIALASVRLGTIAPPPAPPPVWGDITLSVDLGTLVFSLNGNCYLAEEMPGQIPAPPGSMSRVLSAILSYDVLHQTFIADGLADLCIPKRTDDGHGKDTTLMHLHAPFRFKIGDYDSVKDNGFDFIPSSDSTRPGRVFYAKLGGPVTIGASAPDKNGITHSDVSISDPVSLTIRGLQPIQGAVTLDMNAGLFTAALKIHQPFSTDSGGDQQKSLSFATVTYKYALSGEFDSTGFLQVKFPGLDPHPKQAAPSGSKVGGKLDVGNIDATGEFYVYASLNGTASDLKVDPDWLPSFHLPDIGISAVVEADLSGEVSANPSLVYIHGQAYADLGFTIAGHPFSFPYSKDISYQSTGI